MAHFFIDRPIFAWVIAILMMLGGLLAISILPVAQYPEIASPQVIITGSYPGASARTVEESVTQVIEQKMVGLDNLEYMSSTSDSAGRGVVTMTFKQGTDGDIAQVQVQNKLQMAVPMLPDEVQRQGVTVNKSTASFFLVLSFVSPDGSMTSRDLSDYVSSYIVDPISRVFGVGEVQLFGAQYAMRIWTDPEKLKKYKINASDITAAVRSQNTDITAGKLGNEPAIEGQRITFTVKVQDRYNTVEQFEKIILKTQEDGSMVRLKDIARVELDGESYMAAARQDGMQGAGLGIKLASGANAIDTASSVKTKMEELATYFPSGLSYTAGYDTTPFVSISLQEVRKTLIEAIVLVFFLMYLFLQDIRATLIPTIAVPVVLLGTFGVMYIAGFSINTLTMFGMVLAIGLLVDDAIVVVENVERVMHEENLSPRDAARKSMTQITGALVGIGLVLSAVFVPMAFFGGSTGVIYRQFSITIVSAMGLSVLVAIILTPALCATMIKPLSHAHNSPSGSMSKNQSGFFGAFNRFVDNFTNSYKNTVERILRRPLLMLIGYVLIIAAMVFLFMRMPTSFLPDEDQGVLIYQVQLPEGASRERTLEVVKDVENHFLVDEKEAVKNCMAVLGYSFNGLGSNVAMGFVTLRDWDERQRDDLKAAAVAQRALQKKLFTGDAQVYTFLPPAIIELGTASGFDLELMDNAGLGHDELTRARNMLLGMAAQHQDQVINVRPNGLNDTDMFKLNIDNEKAMAQNLHPSEIATTLSALWGGTYINNFTDKGRSKKVMLQNDASSRMQPSDFNKIYIRNSKGDMVPLSSVTTSEWIKESPRLERYNGMPSMEIMGSAAKGRSSGEAMRLMEELSAQLPLGIGLAWTGLSYQEKMSGDQAPMLYAISVLVIFLCLAALYESWTIPFSVMLILPLGIIGALVGANLRGLTNDVYFQVGLLTTVGLSAKNAILIVEFAKELEEKGMEIIAATVEACRLRLRPIIMTSLAFMLGVLPLAISSGAGSGGQNAIGTGVLAGMFSATALGIYYIPLSFVVVSKLFRSKKKQNAMPAEVQQQA